MSSVIDQYEYNIAKGPLFEPYSSLPDNAPTLRPARYIAYYLPQFHRIAENDRAWGAGFTEWTNITKALPRYTGHYQPRLPADLGFYNLAHADTIKTQMDLARRGGLFGFCIHHYWFSGTEVLQTPLKLILANPDLDLPFCLNWANETWSRRWDGSEHEIIIEQRHQPDDGAKFARSIISAVRDPRYITIDGRPLLMIYRPGIIPNCKAVIEAMRDVFRREGIADPFIIMPEGLHAEAPRLYGLDGAAGFPPHKAILGINNQRRKLDILDPNFAGGVVAYEAIAASAQKSRPTDYPFFPGVFPNWDNEARRPCRSMSFYGSTPAKYGAWLMAASQQALLAEAPDQRIVFINAWNEWAEGAYLEPDRHFGFAYLAETRRCLDTLSGQVTGVSPGPQHAPDRFATRPSLRHYPRNWSFDAVRKIRHEFRKPR